MQYINLIGKKNSCGHVRKSFCSLVYKTWRKKMNHGGQNKSKLSDKAYF